MASTCNFTVPSYSEKLAFLFSLIGEPLAPTIFAALSNSGLSSGLIESKIRDDTTLPRMYTPSCNFRALMDLTTVSFGVITSLIWPLLLLQAPLLPRETAFSSLKNRYRMSFHSSPYCYLLHLYSGHLISYSDFDAFLGQSLITCPCSLHP